ncbi:MAG: hypothetical protein K2L83_01065 [Muribaculaceae bacterium]|nr:hypothetical protein [Muribaculaceae bacterium]
MKLKATLSIIAAVLLAMIAADVSARTIREEMTVDGIEKPHRVYNKRVVDSLLLNRRIPEEHGSYWAVTTPDTIAYCVEGCISGLLSNDFDKFYKHHPLLKIAPLRRHTQYKEQTEQMQEMMTECRQRLVDDGAYFASATNGWYISHNYDMTLGGFLLSTYNNPLHFIWDEEEFAATLDGLRNSEESNMDFDYFRTNIRVLPKMHHHFRNDNHLLFVPISNLDVAMLIEEFNGPDGAHNHLRPTFDIFYKTRVAYPDEPKISYLELDDIFLVHTPTGQILWSAKDGDQSQDFRLE